MTLTLKGTLAASDTKVWGADGKLIEETAVPTPTGTTYQYKIPTGETVTVQNSSVLDTNGEFDGIIVKDGMISVMMDANKELDGAKFAADEQTYAIHFEGGVKGAKLGAYNGSKFVAVPDADITKDGDTWYVKAKSGVQCIQVDLGENSFAFATDKATSVYAVANDGNVTKDVSIDDKTEHNVIELFDRMSGDVYVKGAAMVVVGTSNVTGDSEIAINPVRLGWQESVTGGKFYVAVGTTLTVDKTASKSMNFDAISAVIAQVGATEQSTKKIGEDVSAGLNITAGLGGTDGVKLVKGVQVTLDNVTAKAGGTALKSGDYVVAQTDITDIAAVTDKGTAVISTADGALASKEAITSITGTSDVKSDISLAAAVKITKSDAAGKVTKWGYVNEIGSNPLPWDSNDTYVKVGEKIQLDLDTVGRGITLTATTGGGTADVTDAGANGAFYFFTLGVKDVTVTVAQS